MATKRSELAFKSAAECEPGLFVSEIAPGTGYTCGKFRVGRLGATRALVVARGEDIVQVDQEPSTVGDAIRAAWEPVTFRGEGHAFRVERGRLLRDGEPVTLRGLLEYAVDSKLWGWLRARGYGRPNPSGPSGTRGRANEERPRKVYSFSLSNETSVLIDALVPVHKSRSGAVEAAVQLLAKQAK